MKRITFLVVDDDAHIRTSVRACLEGDGHSVAEASDGAAALDRVRRDPPDVMLLDLAMPGLAGMTVLAELGNALPRAATRVIVMSAHGSVKAAMDAVRFGAADFLEKPFTPDDLRLSIASVLHDPPAIP